MHQAVRKSNRALLVLVLVVLGWLVSPATTLAAEKPGLRVAPLRKRVVQDPGTTSTGSITLTNETEAPAEIRLSSENFRATNEFYDYSFETGVSSEWIHFVDQDIVLAPEEKRAVSYRLAVPQSAAGGSYDIALFASTKEVASDTNITQIKRVSSLMYLDVTGALNKSGSLLGIDGPWLTLQPKLPVSVRFANQGNAHIDTRIELSLSNLVTRKSVGSPTIIESLSLPQSTRRLESQLSLGKLPGLYQVRATYANPEGTPTTVSFKLVYLPTWAVVVVFGTLSTIIFAILQRKAVSKKS